MLLQVRIEDVLEGRDLEVEALSELLKEETRRRESLDMSVSGDTNSGKKLHEVSNTAYM